MPPMSATELAKALGFKNVVAQSVGVHMSSFRLADPKGNFGSPLRIGGWELECTLTSAPLGKRVPGKRPGPVALRQLGPDDKVRSIRVAPPRAP